MNKQSKRKYKDQLLLSMLLLTTSAESWTQVCVILYRSLVEGHVSLSYSFLVGLCRDGLHT